MKNKNSTDIVIVPDWTSQLCGTHNFINLTIGRFLEQGYPGGRNLVVKALQLKTIPEAAMNITLSSITISPFERSVETILLFLTEIFEKGGVHSTMNC